MTTRSKVCNTGQFTLINRKTGRLCRTGSHDPKTMRHVILSRKHNSIVIIQRVHNTKVPYQLVNCL